jgi:hypothetical protein
LPSSAAPRCFTAYFATCLANRRPACRTLILRATVFPLFIQGGAAEGFSDLGNAFGAPPFAV